MSTRQIVSYDDITLPYDSPAEPQPAGRPPPAKKRKKNNQKAKQVDSSRHVNVPKPRNSEITNVDDEMDEYDEEESRELTHEEIWDDSALVDAWEAAQQEYEVYHGTAKKWKNKPVKKSPLWYNVPVDQIAKGTDGVPTAQSSTAVAQSDKIEPAEPDSQPLNFDTFVPTHDPSLNAVDPSSYVGAPSGDMVSQDEAFSRAMTAMYWGGYWTAMYHCQRHLSAHSTEENEADAEEEAEEES